MSVLRTLKNKKMEEIITFKLTQEKKEYYRVEFKKWLTYGLFNLSPVNVNSKEKLGKLFDELNGEVIFPSATFQEELEKVKGDKEALSLKELHKDLLQKAFQELEIAFEK